MDHTYCIVERTHPRPTPRRRDTYASRIERLKEANGKDVSVTENLMVEAGAWLKVVIKDEEEEEEVSCMVISEGKEEEMGKSCSIVASEEQEKPDSRTPNITPTQTSPPLQRPTCSRLERTETCKRASVTEKGPKCPNIPRSASPSRSPNPSSVINEDESHKAYLERAAARIRQFQMELKKARTFSIERFQDSARDLQYYTGLPDYATFLTLYEFLRPKGSCQMQYWGSIFKGKQRTGGNELGRHRKLSPMDELFLTLIRLRRGLQRKDLAARFGVSGSVVTRVYITWCNVMYERFQRLPIVWPSELEGEDDGKLSQECGSRGNRQYVLKTVPAAVKEAYLQAAAYLTQSDLPVGSETHPTETHPYDRPFNDEFIDFLENYSTRENVQKDDRRDDGLTGPQKTDRQGDKNLPKPKTSSIRIDGLTEQL